MLNSPLAMSEGVITIVTNAQRESRGMLRWKTGGVNVTHLKVFEKSRLGGILVTVSLRIANKIFQHLLWYRPVLQIFFWLAMAETCHWGDSKKLCSLKWEQWGPKMQYWTVVLKWNGPGPVTPAVRSHIIILGQISLWLPFFTSEYMNAR